MKITKFNRYSCPRRETKANLIPNQNYKTRKTKIKTQMGVKRESNKIVLQAQNKNKL
jgi:hypothetical protein